MTELPQSAPVSVPVTKTTEDMNLPGLTNLTAIMAFCASSKTTLSGGHRFL